VKIVSAFNGPPGRPAPQTTAPGTPFDSQSISSWPPFRPHPWQRPDLQRDTFPPMQFSPALSLPKIKEQKRKDLAREHWQTTAKTSKCETVFSELVHIRVGGAQSNAPVASESVGTRGHDRAPQSVSGRKRTGMSGHRPFRLEWRRHPSRFLPTNEFLHR
jgi:hypothetical protein